MKQNLLWILIVTLVTAWTPLTSGLMVNNQAQLVVNGNRVLPGKVFPILRNTPMNVPSNQTATVPMPATEQTTTPANMPVTERSLLTNLGSLFGGSEKIEKLKELEEYDDEYDEKEKKVELKEKISLKENLKKGKLEAKKLELELKKNLKKLKLEDKVDKKLKIKEKEKMKYDDDEYDDEYGTDEYGSDSKYGGSYKSKSKDSYDDKYEDDDDEYEEKDSKKKKLKMKLTKHKDMKGKKKKPSKEKDDGYDKEYPDEYAKSDYPKQDYPKPDYPKPDYPKAEYPKPDYPKANDDYKAKYEDDYAPPPPPAYKPSPMPEPYQAYPMHSYPGHYKVDSHPKGKYIPQYRQATVVMNGEVQNLSMQTRGSNMPLMYGHPATLYRSAPYPPPSPPPSSPYQDNVSPPYMGSAKPSANYGSYGQPSQDAYMRKSAYAQPAPPPPQPQYVPMPPSPPPPPPIKYASPQAPPTNYGPPPPPPYQPASAPAPYSPPSPAYQKSSPSYDTQQDEYERAKLKLIPVKMMQTAPGIEVNSYMTGGPSAPNYEDASMPYVSTGESLTYPVTNYNATSYDTPDLPAPPSPPSYGAGAANYAAPPPALLPMFHIVPYANVSKDMTYDQYGAYAALINRLLQQAAPLLHASPPMGYSAPPPGGAHQYQRLSMPTYSYQNPYQNYSKSEFQMPVAVTNLYCNPHGLCSCTLYMTEINKHNMLISGVCSGLKPNTYYALHIYEFGDVTSGCDSIGGHYNPLNSTHGYINGPSSHIGDLGNIKADANGVAFINKLKRDSLSVMCSYDGSYSILGRALGLSDAKDDYGLGGNYNSLKNGNSGKVIACGVIGLANKENSYETRELQTKMASIKDAGPNDANAAKDTR